MKDSLKYLGDIKGIIPFQDKHTKEFLKEIQEFINEYELSSHTVTYDMLVDEFGTPEEIITSYFGENPTSLIKNLKRKMYIRYAFISVISAICILSLMIGGYKMYQLNEEYKQVIENKPIYKYTEIEVIEWWKK